MTLSGQPAPWRRALTRLESARSTVPRARRAAQLEQVCDKTVCPTQRRSVRCWVKGPTWSVRVLPASR